MITIERELLERAAALLNPDRSPSALFHQRRDCADAIRAALSAPATAPEHPTQCGCCQPFCLSCNPKRNTHHNLPKNKDDLP